MRKIGSQMGYKASVVLSHMATGRVPIPIDRSEELADALELDKRAFLMAVLRQRHNDVDWQILTDSDAIPSSTFSLELQALGVPLDELNREQRSVMREVASERSPRKRWLSVHEVFAVEALRAAFPGIETDGLDQKELDRIRSAGRTAERS